MADNNSKEPKNLRKSNITLTVMLDDQNVPEKLFWNADENPSKKQEETNAFALAIWEGKENAIMKIDLWTKEMMVGDMKRFYIQTIGSIADALVQATGDNKMGEEIEALCDKLSVMLQHEEGKDEEKKQ